MGLHRHTRWLSIACLAGVLGCLGFWEASAQSLVDGEFDDIDLGRQLIERPRFPTVGELRRAVAEPAMRTVLMMKLHGDGSNHFLPIWSGDGTRLALERSPIRKKSSKLLLYASLAQEHPAGISSDSDTYDYMFRWALNGDRSFVFARIDASSTSTQIVFSPDGEKLDVKTPDKGRHLSPTLYERTDGIYRLVYELDGKLLHQAWNTDGPIDPPLVLAGGSSPRWSRDGFRLLLARQQSVIVRNLVDEQDIELPLIAQGIVRSPSWAPDERHAAFYLSQPGENRRWRIHVSPVSADGTGRFLGDDVVVNPDFDSEGPSWEPSGRRIWLFSHAHRRQAYYPLIAASIETGELSVVDYPNCCTTPNDLAINPVTAVPEIAFVAHDGLPQDLFIVFLNHF